MYEGNVVIVSKFLIYDIRFFWKKIFEVYFLWNVYLEVGVNYIVFVIMLKSSYIVENSGMNYNFCFGINVFFMKFGLKVLKYSFYVY